MRLRAWEAGETVQAVTLAEDFHSFVVVLPLSGVSRGDKAVELCAASEMAAFTGRAMEVKMTAVSEDLSVWVSGLMFAGLLKLAWSACSLPASKTQPAKVLENKDLTDYERDWNGLAGLEEVQTVEAAGTASSRSAFGLDHPARLHCCGGYLLV